MNTLPLESVLYSKNQSYNYIDVYEEVYIDSKNEINAIGVCKVFFSSSPKWVEQLMILRDRIVARFGLKTSSSSKGNHAEQLANFTCVEGEQLGLFRVFYSSEKEVVIGENDKHLNFRISFFIHEEHKETNYKKLSLSTTVVYNNWLGRLYFLPVYPFHRLIVPVILKSIMKEMKLKR